MTMGEKIKAARKSKGYTQEELGSKCGTTKQTIFKYEGGIVTNIPLDRIQKIAYILNFSPAYLMGWEEPENLRPLPENIIPMPKTYKVPLVGTIACGKPILAVEEADEIVDVPEWVHADLALRCKGDSMINARIFDGDIVYIHRQPTVETGQIAAVRIDDEATLKKVYYTPGSDRITLRSCNPLYPDMVYEGEELSQMEILGLAVGFYSTVRHEQ